MLNLAEYRKRPASLADYLPWAALVAPGVVLNKDGSFQRSARFRGPDLESSTEAELVGTCARLNNVLRRFGSGWALFFEAERHEAYDYPASAWPDAVSWLIDQERRAMFEQEGSHFESSSIAPVHHRAARNYFNLKISRPKALLADPFQCAIASPAKTPQQSCWLADPGQSANTGA